MASVDEEKIFDDVETAAAKIKHLIRIYHKGEILPPYDATMKLPLTAAHKAAIKERVKVLFAAIQTRLQDSIIPTL